jgi:hypothetical protein
MAINKEDAHPSRLSKTHNVPASDAKEISALDAAFPVGTAAAATPSDPSEPLKPRQPPYLFHSGASLLAMTRKNNLTIAQLVYDNERSYLTPEQIHEKLMKIWAVMDGCIHTGVTTSETIVPGRLMLKRRAPMLYK